MNLITSLTSAPLQTHTIILDSGATFRMQIYWVPLQQGWFITNLVYGDFTLNGMRICNNPNMLYQWQNKLPFGLACFSVNNREPSLQDDFSSGASSLYVLSQDECEAYADYVRSGDVPSA
jgi:hypothetical protein